MTGERPRPTFSHTCTDCGKLCYPSRKAAKQAARRLHPGEHLSELRCGDSWHFGHTPRNVIGGNGSRHLPPPWTSAGYAAGKAAAQAVDHVKHTAQEQR